MSELRWILLAAGLVLIGAIYVLGTRSRQRSSPPLERSVRVDAPAPPPVDAPVSAAVVSAPIADAPRIEPSLSSAPSYEPIEEHDEPTIDFDEPAVLRAQARREPTLGTETTVVVQRPEPSPESPFEEETVREVRPARVEAEPEAPQPSARPQQRIVAVRVVATAPLRFEGSKLLEVAKAEGLEYGRYEIFHCLHADGRPVFSLASLREPGTFDLGTMPMSAFPGVALFAVLPGPLPPVETFDQLIFTARAFAAQLGGTLADDRGAPLTMHRITRLREEMVDYERAAGAG